MQAKTNYNQPILGLLKMICIFSIMLLKISNLSVSAQSYQNNYVITHEDSLALENVIVEKYYISDSTDWNNSTISPLPKCSVTYRIYIDMKPNYNLQLVYGNQKHNLVIETTTRFYNDLDADALTGFNVDSRKLSKGNIALDSWLTMGAASRGFTGILRSEDTSSFSFITNRPSLKKADGLTKGILPDFKTFNLNLDNSFNNDSTFSKFSTSNGGWAAPGGVKGPTEENRVLIAQLTTNGKLSFEINVQIGTPSGGYIQFVANNPEGSELKYEGLTYKQKF